MGLRGSFSAGAFYSVLIFCISYILFFPVPYYFFPNVGSWFTPVLNPVVSWLGNLAGVEEPFTRELWSDATGHYLFTFFLMIVSMLSAAILVGIFKKPKPEKLAKWFYTFLSYYLALTLLKYGADKIFKHQFYLPEPNTLFTPVGQMTPDMLFWSTMGSSYSYTVFSGIVEIVPALLLLFRKTRLAGALMAFAVMLNVVMINFGFDVTVKLYSLFLLLITMILIAPHVIPLYRFFIRGERTAVVIESYQPVSQKSLLWYTLIKTAVIGLFLYEACGFYFATNNLNDDLSERPPLYGAYDVYLFTDMGKIIPASMSNPGRFRRIFFHRRNYLIIQTMNDHFIDYQVAVNEDSEKLTLYETDSAGEALILSDLSYKVNDDKLVIYGYFFDSYITLFSQKIELNTLPLLHDDFHWTIDSFKNDGVE